MWKRISQKRVRTLVIAVLAFYEFGTFHVQREEYRQLPWLLCVWELRIYIYLFTVYYSKTNEPLLYLTSDVLPPLLEIEIVIRIAHWSGLIRLIFPIKRRRVMLEGRKGRQTRGRQIRRWGKQRERLSQVLRDTCWVFSIRIDGSFIGVSYSFADWALLIEKWIDYVVTIRFHSRSDHSWLPCPFFCCLECYVNRIPPSLPNSAHADFWLARWTGWVLLFLCSFLVNGCQTVVDVFLLLPRWAFEFSC